MYREWGGLAHGTESIFGRLLRLEFYASRLYSGEQFAITQFYRAYLEFWSTMVLTSCRVLQLS